MSEVNVTKVIVNNPICDILDPFVFTIEFEALNKLEADLEWKIFYISAVNNDGEGNQDIELDNIFLGPIERGVMMFDYAVNPPDYKNMDVDSVLGLQAILISANYKEKEFIRIAYYMNSFYKDMELREKPPAVPQYDKICRHIFVENPRIVKFCITWDAEEKDDFKEFDKENEQIELMNSIKMNADQNSNSNITNESTQENIFVSSDIHGNVGTNGKMSTHMEAHENANMYGNTYSNADLNERGVLSSNGASTDLDKCELFNANINGISRITIDNNNNA
ncbi:histone chaperone ASF1, putative [Plasmodium knowlesi strain H]|uniref:Histone chaperone ASF1, putative n=3 Tax=Plasmodium knowlesi TaxID=5850 RepID=A0A5K1UFW8_PLAKH|nr:histone chaperone ASF1, putative [Plasmodium knowlesi strain H]OTN64094.1 putative Chromatin assembly protein (Asf1) [Plasmodium knowlesi]CAA9991033.1 histone chaperone ASF1, putative [Plasmodium knowlesi strain H]SBO20688.1 histone chaperone ASF1, putative [Plasmodium knowlesi strain H]SBO21118.1 histone chaperone ASF1, putative [Plasmodium knowlesi strain H]VVS80507.1 histone chaperone ASF1, putative [Plasmodium knowlesi strain H]|eukprot:XP_002262315.1 chromatin assembly protein (asf1), putative [Plasmodium knowlesi strain H]